MASSSKMEAPGEDGEEELERFDDFTIASSWERFISEIEAVCRLWLADGPKNLLEKGAVHLGFSRDLYMVKFELKYLMKSYCMEYYFETTSGGKVSDWNCSMHDLQLSFGVKEFLVISPQSASGVLLDAPEASKLLSATAIALSNCSSLWPAFVPVHDPSRKAYIGIQNMGTVFTRRFEGDRIGSQVPVKLMHLEGLYELFVSKFFAALSVWASPQAQVLCNGVFTDAFSALDVSTHLFKVYFTMKLTYRTLPFDDDDNDVDIQGADANISESNGTPRGDTRSKAQWDDDCPWSEWYSAEDPIKGFELIAMWSEKMVENSLEMAELENASPHEAHKWIVFPNLSSHLVDDSRTMGFASQLHLLVNALDISFEAQFMEDFVSVEKSGSDALRSSMVIPPPTVLDRVLKDLFHEGQESPDPTRVEHKSSRAFKGAPLGSLFAQFCLHSLWFGNCNIRAIASLWIEFVREVRWCWEESQPLPHMSSSGSIDLSTCLINQKLQMLAICIEKMQQLSENYQDSSSAPIEEDDQFQEATSHMETLTEDLDRKRDRPMTADGLDNSGVTVSSFSTQPEDSVVCTDHKPVDGIRRGSAGVVGNMMLLKSHQNLHAPFTQDAPLMTEDMHEERLKAVEAFGDSFSFSAQLEKDILSSDMSAFKAANPDSCFEDFIRWHSPGDWVDDDIKATGVSQSHSGEGSKHYWPPQGRLSERMSEHGNSWRKIWNDAPALPASEQKPLLDPNREGEKVLHYLETVQPHQLLEQMVCTAFRAAADTLNLTNFGGLKQMTTKIEQLYLTMASTLKPLQSNRLSGDSEIIEDVRRLCVVFDHVEKLLTLAASLHRKFAQAPRLGEAIFSDYYSFYLPKMGKGSVGDDVHEEFKSKQHVRFHERQVLMNMFSPPTANQSWRKVLSMGNLLNGHEPILREIIFSTRDRVSGNHYNSSSSSSSTSSAHEEEIETYRMYICGTSNDLQVALSVASCD